MNIPDEAVQAAQNAYREHHGDSTESHRPAAPVEGLETVTTVTGKPASLFFPIGTELVTRSQAEAIIAALQSDVTGSASVIEHLTQRAEHAEADNAALTARVKELEEHFAEMTRSCLAERDRNKVLEADNKRLRDALGMSEAAISEFYRYQYGGEMRGSYDGKPERDGLWKAMYKARAALGEVSRD